jgi:hypothetical protein
LSDECKREQESCAPYDTLIMAWQSDIDHLTGEYRTSQL